jgi:hypothetical protein
MTAHPLKVAPYSLNHIALLHNPILEIKALYRRTGKFPNIPGELPKSKDISIRLYRENRVSPQPFQLISYNLNETPQSH